MPRRIEETARKVVFTFEGQQIEAQAGDTVAAALIAHGIRHLRDSAVSGAPRGIYCMMGACYDCLMEIDGLPNRQACMTEAVDGLVVRRMTLVTGSGAVAVA